MFINWKDILAISAIIAWILGWQIYLFYIDYWYVLISMIITALFIVLILTRLVEG